MNQRNPVAALSVADRNRRLRASFDKGDTVRQDRRNPDVWLVSSSQYANVHYRVRDGRSCGCAWFARTGQACRHMVRVSWELHQQRKQAIAA